MRNVRRLSGSPTHRPGRQLRLPPITGASVSLRLVGVVSALVALLMPLLQVAPTYAAQTLVTGMTWSGSAGNTFTSGGTLYARSGAALQLTVTASATAVCVRLASAAGNGGTTVDLSGPPFVFTASNAGGLAGFFTAGTGSGTITLYAEAYASQNAHNRCTANQGDNNPSASYTLDNTGPAVTSTLNPAVNANGWNNSASVGITWSATDSGSGVANGFPNPATDSVTAEGVTSKTATAKDNVGNSTTGSVTVKVDRTLPTISSNRTPAANANGWNNGSVTVTFTCTDPNNASNNTPGSGIAGCSSPQTVSTEGANQSVSGTATDLAGNSASTTVSTINIDKTPPSLSGAPTTSPNTAGWYNGSVTVHWTCSDALSGISGSCPADSTIASEGTGQMASASASDRAGNTTTATSSPAVNIDKTPPVTTASAPPAWNNTNVTVNLSASDNLSGVANTFYQLDGGAQQTGTSVTISSEGMHSLTYWSVDRAGNVETAHSVAVNIDKTPPTISHTLSPLPNVNGWNNSNVTVTFSCADQLSGIATCTSPQTVSGEGQNQTVTGTAKDNAGNTATDPAQVSVDKTPPSITAGRTPDANANGWNNTDVQVSFSCADSLSGVVSCPAAQTLGEGKGQSVTGTVSDAAGNTASATVSNVNVDKTPPSLSGAPTTSPNTAGWYNGNVTVHWTCSDALSGISGSCPADSTVGGEGSNLSAMASVSDLAGNIAAAAVSGLKIDRTAPTTTTSAPTGWQTSNVTLTLTATDNLSGVAATYYTVDGGAQQSGTTVNLTADGTHTVEYWSVDVAGNAETHHTVQVQIDQTSPTIGHGQTPAANTNGWNNAPVTVSFTCSDATSGVASCSGPQTVSTDGAGQQVVGTAVDNAGNTNTDTASVNIDTAPPTITGAPDRPANGNGWYNADVKVSFTCGDALSGVDTCSGPTTLTEGLNQSLTGTATDLAGNNATATVSGINIDETPPTLSGAPTSSPNSNGWYNGDVTITWTCGDALSGIDGACPANQTITGEGSNLFTTASVSDKAGNADTESSAPVNIDRTPPTTDISAPNNWVNSDVTVTLSPYDALSGVASTHYVLDGGTEQTGASLTIGTEGVHTLQYWSIDNAGNVEAQHTATIEIDKTAPTITDSQAPVANSAGWNNSDVTVTFTCTDQLSGVASCTSPQTVTTEGQNQSVTGTATDNAGNSATDSATVSIDKTPPTISGAADRAANGNGWYNNNVTVSFACADTLSGVATCPAPTTIGEGANQTVNGTALDAAGNSTSASVGPLNIDETPPTLSGAATVAPNANGWYNGDVTIHWTCTDALSGVDSCPADSTITGEGDNLLASATDTDRAGNSTTQTVSGIKIDRTPPVTSANTPSADWNNTDVTMTLSAQDGLSGVAATYYTLDGGPQQTGTSVTISDEGIHALTYWSVDNAGNVETAHSVTIKIDKTPPTVTPSPDRAANGNGWYNNNVTVAFTCSDSGSGVASCPTAQTVSSEGKNQAVSGTALDKAGNSATGTAYISIDKTPPTIAGGSDRPANGNGWYNADVTVSFACGDALSGVAGCSSPATLHEGANQSVTGTATDAADNSATYTVSGLNVDETPPTLTGAATTQPNAAGWYNGNVLVHWTAGDALSGLDPQTVPGDDLITGEGKGLLASASVSDLAGNVTNSDSSPVNIDRTAPVTDVSAPSGWVNNDVTLSLTATDNLSGVKATYYQLDGGPQQTGSSVTISTEGDHTLKYWSVDNADNVEAAKTVEIKIDKTAPSITFSQAPAANTAGWNSSGVTVTFTCSDSLSGVQSCTADGTSPASPSRTVTTEGQAQPVSGTAMDNAGNTASAQASISIDKTPPTISGAPDRPANGNGWYNGDVTVSFTCADSLSGLAGCSSPTTLHEGAGQSATGNATDAAGNTASATVSGINVDETRPALTGATTTSPNAAGWYNAPVTVQWTCSDALSGIASCPADTTVSSEGSSLSTSATVSDRAGNTTIATVSGLKIDQTAPKTTSNAPAGWQNSDVTVMFTATDNLSGVAATYYTVDGRSTQSGSSVRLSEGVHTLKFWSVDNAGNAETAQTAVVQIDETAPAITGTPATQPNANGWYNKPVVVNFTCSDNLSGVASCQSPLTVYGDGAAQTVTGTAVDNAANIGKTSVSLKVDQTPPTITSISVQGGPFVLGAVPAPTCSATDATSGVDANGCKVAVTGGLANGVGTFNYTATATDLAGNTATVQGTYQVIYNVPNNQPFFLQPICDTAHMVTATCSTSIFKGGSTVPVKFQLKDASGQIVQPTTAPMWLTPARGVSTQAVVDTSVYSAPASSGNTYTYDSTDQQWIYNWNTSKSQSGYYWRVGVKLDDGMTYTVNIGLR